MPRKPATAKDAKPRRGLVAALLYWGMVLCVWLAIAVFGLVVWYSQDLPDVRQYGLTGKRPSVTLLAADQSELFSFGDLYGETVRPGELPKSLPQAVIATEDRRFYGHFGVDVLGLARAVVANLSAGRVVQGGSTISQQLAKNLFLTPDRTLKRKIQEVLLAFWLEWEFTKDEILGLYLNRVYLGAGTYGVEAAAQKYFGVSARRVSVLESAVLAGLLKAPSRLAPSRNPKGALARAEVVLANMVRSGYLTQAQASAAKRDKLRARPRRRISGARYFADWILEQVPDYVGHSEADLVVLTTLEPGLQTSADALVEALLARQGDKHRIGQAALLAMTPDGAIRAMVGGRDYRDSQFNRAVQARRQPGSAFKPVVYLAGLESGLRPDSTLVDRPIDIGGWRPRNNSGRHHGRVTLRQALARSINTVAVQVSERAGRHNVIETARRLGIASKLKPRPSLALGTNEVGLMELTGAYAAFANGGFGVLPHAIREIRTTAGRRLYRRQGGGPGRVVSAKHLAQMQDMLAAVIAQGSGRRAGIGRPSAGKTGTTQNSRDAWFVGFTGQLVAGVWLGNDDGGPMRDVSGGGYAALLWRDFMAAAHRGLAVVALRRAPAGTAAADEDADISVSVTVKVDKFVERIWKVLSSGDSADTDDEDDMDRGK
ncbi:MAG: PBP1A family penicillin-binding protein [Alphaproteobacteria bacterium]|nr:PBP1A family penicillin-binding protein [Alphaproteobacteria bacterium]